MTETEAEPFNLLTSKQMLGDWLGLRPKLLDAGITFRPRAWLYYEQNFRGGDNTHNAQEFTGDFRYDVELDFGKMGLIPNATFYLRAIQSFGNGIGGDVGTPRAPYFSSGSPGDFWYSDSQPIRVDKWWWRQRFLDDRIEVRLGRMLNVIDLFDQNDVSGNHAVAFMNRALNYNVTIPVVRGGGAFVKAWPTDWLYVQMSALDPDLPGRRTGFDTDTLFHGPAHFISNFEFGILPKWFSSKNGTLPGNYRFGLWYDPRSKPIYRDSLGGALSTRFKNDDVGGYFNFDQMIYKENNDPKDKQGLGIFARYGFAHGDVNMIRHAWNLGATYRGLIETRDKDLLGFGVAQNIISTQYRHEINSRADRETVYELFYSIEVTPWLTVTPDVQVITNPGGTKDDRDAIVGGIRAMIEF